MISKDIMLNWGGVATMFTTTSTAMDETKRKIISV